MRLTCRKESAKRRASSEIRQQVTNAQAMGFRRSDVNRPKIVAVAFYLVEPRRSNAAM
jgi:hypothetical protein